MHFMYTNTFKKIHVTAIILPATQGPSAKQGTQGSSLT